MMVGKPGFKVVEFIHGDVSLLNIDMKSAYNDFYRGTLLLLLFSLYLLIIRPIDLVLQVSRIRILNFYSQNNTNRQQ